MRHLQAMRTCGVAALSIALAAPVHAVLPLIAGLGKQLVKDLLFDGVKSQLMGSLSGMGCKGAAMASLLTPGATLRASLPSAMPSLPAGMPQLMGGAMPALPVGGDTAQMTALMQQAMAGRMPSGAAMSPELMAQMNGAMPALQQTMAQPLSRAETLAVFDEMAELGIMTPAMQSEMRDCVMLAPPSAGNTLGMTGAMFKSMLLPQLRAAREQMANLQPEEREQLANDIAQAMKDASPEDRKAFQDGFGAGFFPPEVTTAVKAKLR
jgi:hypothetical protein